MTIYERLQREHEKQKDLARRIMKTSGDSEARNALFDELYREAEAHAAAEEQTLYATLLAMPEGQDIARHSVHEHQEAACLLEQLNELDRGNGGWIHKFEKLKQELEHHIEEEENEVFAKARELIDRDTAKDLARRFDERKSRELAEMA